MSSNGASQPVAIELLPQTLSESNGESKPCELGELAGKPLLVLLRVADVIEQESLHVSIWGSANATDWGPKPLFWFPQRFYRGVTPAALDLGQRPEVKFLQARWELNRWGRGYPVPRFEFSVEIQLLDRR